MFVLMLLLLLLMLMLMLMLLMLLLLLSLLFFLSLHEAFGKTRIGATVGTVLLIIRRLPRELCYGTTPTKDRTTQIFAAWQIRRL